MAYTYKKLTDVALVDSVIEPNLLIEDDGDIKKISANNIAIPQVKADWNETDTTSAAFILNKPDLSQVGGGANVVTYTMSYTTDSGGIKIPSHLTYGDRDHTPVTAQDIVNAWNNNSILRITGASNGSGTIQSIFYTMDSGVVSYATISYFLGSGTALETLTI